MAAGGGYLDGQGIWQFGETDYKPLFSDTLNLLSKSVSDRLAKIVLGAPVWAPVPSAGSGYQVLQANTYITKQNGLVQGIIVVDRPSGTNPGGGTTVAIIPDGFRPPAYTEVMALATGGSATSGPMTLSIDTAGNVRTWTVSGHTKFTINIAWKV